MKIINRILIAIIVLFFNVNNIQAVLLVNGGFESGLDGWTKDWNDDLYHGSATIVNYENPFYSLILYEPKEGNYFVKLETCDTSNNNPQKTVISQNITLKAGDILSGYAAFHTQESVYQDTNDISFVEIHYNSNLISTPWSKSVEDLTYDWPYYLNSPWEYWSWTASFDGEFELKLSVANRGGEFTTDYFNGFPSYALFDDIKVTPVPEPVTFVLFGSSLLGLGVFKLKKEKKRGC